MYVFHETVTSYRTEIIYPTLNTKQQYNNSSSPQPLRDCDCGPETCDAAGMYADQYRDHLLTTCPGGKGLAAFIGEGMGGMTAAMMAPKGEL